MADSVFKKIELVGASSKSFEEATALAVAQAAELGNASWFEVVEHRGSVAGGKIQQYQVTVRVGVAVD